MQQITRSEHANCQLDLSAIATLDRDDCVECWAALHGRPPPTHVSVAFMQRALSFEAQCRALGGVPVSVDKALRKLATAQGQGSRNVHAVKAGNHLVREWNGRSYQVEVLDKGFALDGKTYRSLSGIAKYITGAEWSGPRFFGLT